MSRRARSSSAVGDENAGHRHARLQDLVQRELGGLLRDEVTDPRLDDVRIASLVLSVDYRNARVHFTFVRPGDGEGNDETSPVDLREVTRALENATPFLRGRLAEAIELKRVPELRFVFDAATVP